MTGAEKEEGKRGNYLRKKGRKAFYAAKYPGKKNGQQIAHLAILTLRAGKGGEGIPLSSRREKRKKCSARQGIAIKRKRIFIIASRRRKKRGEGGYACASSQMRPIFVRSAVEGGGKNNYLYLKKGSAPSKVGSGDHLAKRGKKRGGEKNPFLVVSEKREGRGKSG